MNLLLLEMDGPDCVADHSLRLLEAQTSGYAPRTPDYARHLYQPELMELDVPVTGSREFIEFLAQHRWRILLLRSCLKTRSQYHATKRWLKKHGFDGFYYELVLKELRYGTLPTMEWKSLKAGWYGSEGGLQFSYGRIVYLDPAQNTRDFVQSQWSSATGREIETYSGFSQFSPHITLKGFRAKVEPLLEQHITDAIVVQELHAASEAMDEGRPDQDEAEREPTGVETSRRVVSLEQASSKAVQADIQTRGGEGEKPSVLPLLQPPHMVIVPDEGVRRGKDLERDDMNKDEIIEVTCVVEGHGMKDRDEAPVFEEDSEDEETMIVRPRKPRGVKVPSRENLFEDEEQRPHKKQAKSEKQERHTRRSLKAATEM